MKMKKKPTFCTAVVLMLCELMLFGGDLAADAQNSPSLLSQPGAGSNLNSYAGTTNPMVAMRGMGGRRHHRRRRGGRRRGMGFYNNGQNQNWNASTGSFSNNSFGNSLYGSGMSPNAVNQMQGRGGMGGMKRRGGGGRRRQMMQNVQPAQGAGLGNSNGFTNSPVPQPMGNPTP